MSDIKDILGVSRGGAGGDPALKGPKPKKEKMKRPTGLSREAFALLGDSHPIVSSQLLEGLNKNKKDDKLAKPKPSTKGIPTWHHKPFKNSARADGLELRRWSKSFKDGLGRVREAEDAEYYYAKFNKKVPRAMHTHATHPSHTTARMATGTHSDGCLHAWDRPSLFAGIYELCHPLIPPLYLLCLPL